jgi:translation elongation factor EF-Tu-like GTPase
MIEEMYHNCRGCLHFENGSCNKLHEHIEVEEKGGLPQIYKLSEEGKIAEVIKEAYTPVEFERLRELLSKYGLSNKRIAEVMGVLEEELEEAQHEWATEIDLALVSLLDGRDTEYEYSINNPVNFCCKEFL